VRQEAARRTQAVLGLTAERDALRADNARLASQLLQQQLQDDEREGRRIHQATSEKQQQQPAIGAVAFAVPAHCACAPLPPQEVETGGGRASCNASVAASSSASTARQRVKGNGIEQQQHTVAAGASAGGGSSALQSQHHHYQQLMAGLREAHGRRLLALEGEVVAAWAAVSETIAASANLFAALVDRTALLLAGRLEVTGTLAVRLSPHDNYAAAGPSSAPTSLPSSAAAIAHERSARLQVGHPLACR
jgi:hypothetical protein